MHLGNSHILALAVNLSLFPSYFFHEFFSLHLSYMFLYWGHCVVFLVWKILPSPIPLSLFKYHNHFLWMIVSCPPGFSILYSVLAFLSLVSLRIAHVHLIVGSFPFFGAGLQPAWFVGTSKNYCLLSHDVMGSWSVSWGLLCHVSFMGSSAETR